MHLDILDIVNSLYKDTEAGRRRTYMENNGSSFRVEHRIRDKGWDNKPEKGGLGLNIGVV